MDKKNLKTDKKQLYFIISQVLLYSCLIFLIISISLNANYINKLDNFVFYLTSFLRNKFINNLMLFFTFLGESYFYIIILISLIVIFFKKRKIFYPLIIMTCLSGIISTIFKEIIQRARPIGEFVTNLLISYDFPSSYSFPSGHTQTSLVFYFLLTYIILNIFYKGKHKKLYLTFSIIFSSLIMLSRLVLGVHFFTDILGGILIGIILISNFIYFNHKFVIK